MNDTLHEAFWKGEFGNEYTDRNRCGDIMISLSNCKFS